MKTPLVARPPHGIGSARGAALPASGIQVDMADTAGTGRRVGGSGARCMMKTPPRSNRLAAA